MLLTLQIATPFLVSIAWALSLAHALELPGKLRLSKEAYNAMQAIYYPGFTIGAGVGEAGGILATVVLLLATGTSSAAFTLTAVALVGLLAMHATYWIVTHPVNKFWIRDQKMSGLGAGFFSVGKRGRDVAANADPNAVWRALRNKWEWSHVIRAAFAGIALLCLIVAAAQ